MVHYASVHCFSESRAAVVERLSHKLKERNLSSMCFAWEIYDLFQIASLHENVLWRRFITISIETISQLIDWCDCPQLKNWQHCRLFDYCGHGNLLEAKAEA